jgi:hypothetical protein
VGAAAGDESDDDADDAYLGGGGIDDVYGNDDAVGVGNCDVHDEGDGVSGSEATQQMYAAAFDEEMQRLALKTGVQS